MITWASKPLQSVIGTAVLGCKLAILSYPNLVDQLPITRTTNLLHRGSRGLPPPSQGLVEEFELRGSDQLDLVLGDLAAVISPFSFVNGKQLY